MTYQARALVPTLTWLYFLLVAAAIFSPLGQSQTPAAETAVRANHIDTGSVAAETTTSYFPQIAVGEGYTTVFTLLNTGSTDLSGRLTLTDELGRPMNLTLSSASTFPALSQSDDRILASYLDVLMHPGGARFITASPASPIDLIKVGWAKFESTGGTFGGVATYQLVASGKLQTTTGVLSSNAVEVATIPVDNDDSQARYTGYAIANPTGANVYIKVVLVKEDGTPLRTIFPPKLNPVWPNYQVARFLHQDAPEQLTFRGSMVLIASPGQRFSIVALVQNKGLFTTIPVIPAKAPTIN